MKKLFFPTVVLEKTLGSPLKTWDEVKFNPKESIKRKNFKEIRRKLD